MERFNDHLLYQLCKEHHQDLIKEAENERLIRYAHSGQVIHSPFYKKTLCWLGRRLMAWGCNLLKRYEVEPGDLSIFRLCGPNDDLFVRADLELGGRCAARYS